MVTGNAPAGVDVERLEPHADLLEVARNFFAPAVVQELEKHSAEQRVPRFYEHWTRLDAGAKAGGGGLTAPALVNENAAGWRVFQQRVSPDHLLAAAVRGGPGCLTRFILRTVRWRADASEVRMEMCQPEQTVSVRPVGV